MIAILDTNAFNADVNAVGQGLSTLFSAGDEGLLEDVEVWTPKGVVEELVRQYPKRIERIKKILGSVEQELTSFRLQVPDLQAVEDRDVNWYRGSLEARLTGAKRRIVDHPQEVGRVIDWVAMRRYPIRESQPPGVAKGEPDLRHFQKPKTRPVYGVVDAAIWLTVVEAAKQDRVAFITNNSKDFSDPEDRSRPCEQLREDLEAAGMNPEKVEVFPRVIDFNQKFVEPVQEAQERVAAFLGDEGNLEALKAEIADATEWYPLSLGEVQDFEVEIDDAALQRVEVESIHLKRADPAEGGWFATLEAAGRGQIELGIRKADAYGISEESDISVWDWDWNESMVMAEAERDVQMLIEVRGVETSADELDLRISVDDLELL